MLEEITGRIGTILYKGYMDVFYTTMVASIAWCFSKATRRQIWDMNVFEFKNSDTWEFVTSHWSEHFLMQLVVLFLARLLL